MFLNSESAITQVTGFMCHRFRYTPSEYNHITVDLNKILLLCGYCSKPKCVQQKFADPRVTLRPHWSLRMSFQNC